MDATSAKELAFFGRITAGFTHEIKNVLAIIKESAGLMEDLLDLTKDEPFRHWDRFSHRVTIIQQQVQRGVELSTRLNRFAHSPDEPVTRVDFDELIGQLAKLSERFARLREVTLRAIPSNSSITMVTSSVGLQMGLFTLMESCWNEMQGGGQISLEAAQRNDKPCVVVRLADEAQGVATLKEKIEFSQGFKASVELLQDLGGEIDADVQDGFTLAFVGS